ncbi:MAG: peroxidase family protein, partial [Crocosphaera sp.]
YENNNTIQQSFDFSQHEQTLLSDLDGQGISLDEDFFEIEATIGSLDLSIDLMFSHANGNLDLFLFDSTGNRIASSTSLTDNEFINFTVAEAGTYYIQVTSGDFDVDDEPVFSGNTYDLLWDDVISETTFRTFNGLNNNLENPEYGEEGIQLLRLSDPAYDDGLSAPRTIDSDGDPLPSARAISNAIAAQDGVSIPNDSRLSDWFWQWGQFIDHDMGLTEGLATNDSFDIEVPLGDPFFDPDGTGTQVIPLNRAIFDPETGIDSPREQINEITAFLDGSMVYGSTQEVADSIRAFDGNGKLLTSVGDNGETLLPTDGAGNFLAGDIRVNEQLGLISVHTLFVREHNRLTDKIARILDRGRGRKSRKLNELFEESQLNRDDFIYESARRLVGAKIQVITYNEFLPLLIGDDTIADYDGYDATVNPGIANEFSSAAFRVGHTMLSPQLLRVEDDGSFEAIALRDAFFDPSAIVADGIDSLLKGLDSQEAQEIDNFIIDDVRNFLFGPPGAGGFDLVSLNIQRGRDHGIADLNTVRSALNLDPYDDFDELTGGNTELANKFASVYDSIDDVDLWIGGLAEEQANGGVVGETFNAIIADQFTRLRDGDHFYFENDEYLQELKGIVDKNLDDVSLAKIIEANSDVDIAGSAFRVNNPIVV